LKRVGFWFTTSMLALIVSGCGDREGPGARGFVDFALDEDWSGFSHLILATFPTDGGAFDGTPPDGALFNYFGNPRFPQSYYVGETTGTTDHRSWRVVAWLDESRVCHVEECRVPTNGFYGYADYELDDCGREYCGKTEVDFEIDTVLEP
jgi:hypothetical protein